MLNGFVKMKTCIFKEAQRTEALCPFSKQCGSRNADLQIRLRYALKQKKRYYLGIFPKRRTPPPPHPPLLGTPYPKKNFSVYFAFQNLRSIFVLQKKIIFQEHFQNNVGKFTQSFGNRGPPPPFWEKFPNNPVFFLQQDNSDNFEYP